MPARNKRLDVLRSIAVLLVLCTTRTSRQCSLVLALHVRNALPGPLVPPVSAIGSVFAYIGKYSYSIYLWHGPVNAWLPGLVRRVIGVELNRTAVYLIGSIAVGILMSVVLEYPMLRLRDRLFPTRDTLRIVTIGPEQERPLALAAKAE